MALDIDLERLVTVGSVQLSADYLHSDFMTFYDWMEGNGQLDTPAYYDALKLYHPKIVDAISFILEAADYDPDYPHTMRRAIREQKKRATNWHQDYDGTRKGFSVLFSETEVQGFNGVMTGGRGPAVDLHDIATYDYKEGPVVIAQKGFTIPSMPEGKSMLATWHAGARSMDAKFLGIDVLCDGPLLSEG